MTHGGMAGAQDTKVAAKAKVIRVNETIVRKRLCRIVPGELCRFIARRERDQRRYFGCGGEAKIRFIFSCKTMTLVTTLGLRQTE